MNLLIVLSACGRWQVNRIFIQRKQFLPWGIVRFMILPLWLLCQSCRIFYVASKSFTEDMVTDSTPIYVSLMLPETLQIIPFYMIGIYYYRSTSDVKLYMCPSYSTEWTNLMFLLRRWDVQCLKLVETNLTKPLWYSLCIATKWITQRSKQGNTINFQKLNKRWAYTSS